MWTYLNKAFFQTIKKLTTKEFEKCHLKINSDAKVDYLAQETKNVLFLPVGIMRRAMNHLQKQAKRAIKQ